MAEEYDEEYFERGEETKKSCYTNYHWIPTYTLSTAAELIKRARIGKNDRILDYGGAKGYLVKAFRWLGFDAYGIDISKYAIANCDEEIKKYMYLTDTTIFRENQWDIVICKDVAEHIEKEEIEKFLKDIYTICKKAIFIIPLGNGRMYNIPRYELDKTHKLKKPISWWLKKLEDTGFEIIKVTDNMDKIKPNWNIPNGNVYIEAKK